MRKVFATEVFGVDVDPQTRCAHYSNDLDIIAIKFKCCGRWYPCFECHGESAGHVAAVWPKAEFSEAAILCGACGAQLSISEYLLCDSRCPKCGSPSNPGYANHYHLYFER